MRKELEQRFETESKSLEALRERAKAQTVRWAFSTATVLSYQDLGISPGTNDVIYACGYDEASRPIVVQHFNLTVFPPVAFRVKLPQARP